MYITIVITSDPNIMQQNTTRNGLSSHECMTNADRKARTAHVDETATRAFKGRGRLFKVKLFFGIERVMSVVSKSIDAKKGMNIVANPVISSFMQLRIMEKTKTSTKHRRSMGFAEAPESLYI